MTNTPRTAAPGDILKHRALSGLVGYQVKRAHMRILADFRLAVEPFDLTQRTFSLLSLVCENPGASQSAVSRTLGIERSGTVVIVDALEQRGLVTRNQADGDRRAHALRATDAGHALYATALAAIREHEDRILRRLSDHERARLRDLLTRTGPA